MVCCHVKQSHSATITRLLKLPILSMTTKLNFCHLQIAFIWSYHKHCAPIDRHRKDYYL